LDFAPCSRVRNWSLSRWCEKDNQEPFSPYDNFDWPETDDEAAV
jgi:hypothetical protein